MRPIRALCLALMTLSAVPVEARNRATETMLAQFKRQGLGDAEIARNVGWHRWNDLELLPGIYQSVGGFTSRGTPQVTLRGVQLINESDVAICYRFRGQLLNGPLLGGRGSLREGANYLLEPGRYDVVMANTIDSYVGGTPLGDSITSFYLWLPAPGGGNGRCSASAPDGLDAWLARPLPRENTALVKYTPELERRLMSAVPQLPIPAMLRAPGTARLK